MLHADSKAQPRINIQPLPPCLRKDSWLGAEVLLPGDSRLLGDPTELSQDDLQTLRQALYDHSVLVIRNQHGMDPTLMPKIAAIWDTKMINVHSGGKSAITSSNNILSRTSALRIPTAPNAAIIGNGNFADYQGIKELKLRHVVQNILVQIKVFK